MTLSQLHHGESLSGIISSHALGNNVDLDSVSEVSLASSLAKGKGENFAFSPLVRPKPLFSSDEAAARPRQRTAPRHLILAATVDDAGGTAARHVTAVTPEQPAAGAVA